jgi:chemotaxis protein CheC
MTILNEQQQDAVTELINIGFARTAASLSDLTGHRILLNAPQVSVHPMEELLPELSSFIQGEVATVSQIFNGSIAGNALLVLNYEGAMMLTDLLLPHDYPSSHRLDASACEVLTEVGNILLNACLSVFGNLLKIYISFSVPSLHLEALSVLLDSLTIGDEGMKYALVVYTKFTMRDSSVNGYLLIVLGVLSLDSFIEAIDTWSQSGELPT